MSQFLTLVVTGLVSGAIYSLIATCLTLTYQTTGIFNLSYGAIAFVSAFMYYLLNTGLGWSVAPAAVVTLIVLGPGMGWLLDRLVFRSLSDADDTSKIMATIGVLVFLPAVAYLIEQIINGLGAHLPDTTQVAEVSGIGPATVITWHMGSIPITSDQVIVFGIAALVAIGMWLLLSRTRLGLRMRALVDRPGLAQLRGVDRKRTSMLAWIIGTTLASLTGIAAGPTFNSLSPDTYTLITFVAVAAAVAGGFRSIPIAFTAGLVIGILESLIVRYATFASSINGFNSAVPFVVLLVGVVVWGRRRGRVAGAAQVSRTVRDYTSDLPAWRRGLPWTITGALLILYTVWLSDAFWTGQLIEGLAFGLIFLSFVIVTGLGGMVTLAQAAFVTLAGLTAGLLFNQYHVPYIGALVLAVLVAMVFGLLVALPALRLGGLALALATLALGFLCDNVLFGWGWLTNGSDGWAIPRPNLGILNLNSNRSMAIVMIVLVAIGVIITRNLQRSAAGRAAISVTSSDAGARMVGINPTRVKLFTFAIGAGLAGFGGVMLATYNNSASAPGFATEAGLVWLASVVLQGIRRPGGAVVAGISVSIVPAIISSGFHLPFWTWDGTANPYIPNVLFGLGAITMAQDPNGILSLNAALFRAQRDKRRARKAARAGQAGRAVPVTGLPAQAEPVTSDAVPSVGRIGEPATTATTVPATTEIPATTAIAATTAIPATSASADAILVLDGLDAGYGEIQVLKHASLVLARGSITAVVGSNGAGKSTLCSVVGGLIAPTSGRILFNGQDITREPAHDRCRLGLLLAPESRGIFPNITVDDNLSLRLRAEKDRRKVYERFPLLGERRNQPASNLSGGEQQMLTMAPFLVNPPSLLIADEPTLGLAPMVAAEIMRLMGELRDEGVSLLLVEEKAKAVLDIADHAAILELGRVVWTGRPSELAGDDLVDAYLGELAVAEPAARLSAEGAE
jgi:branched-subunit amino acid ABC-type transport system permease component/ABC-type branched-subunit amino acid transport system ATPase component